jgi:protein subunit release factor B
MPRAALTITYARSSGPGGQNVNKVNSKARVVLHLSHPMCLSWIPAEVRQAVCQHPTSMPYVQAAGTTLVMTSDAHRMQSHNLKACLDRMCDTLRVVAQSLILPQVDVGKVERIARLQARDAAVRLADKSRRSDTKASRRPSRRDDGH